MSSKWICPHCKTEYISWGEDRPQAIKWSDGHLCSLIKLENYNEHLKEYH